MVLGAGGTHAALIHVENTKSSTEGKMQFSLHMIRLHAEIFLTLDVASTDASLIGKINSKQQTVWLFPHERTISLLETGVQETLKLNEGERGRNTGYEGKSRKLPPTDMSRWPTLPESCTTLSPLKIQSDGD